MAALTKADLTPSKIAQTIGAAPIVALGQTGYTWGYLNTHPNINMFARCKPIDSDRMFSGDDIWGATKNTYGLIIPNLALPIDTSANWTHDKPTGGSLSPYRREDWLGYDHAAVPCIHSGCTAQVDVNMAFESLRVKTFSFQNIPASSATNVSALNIAAIKYHYFAVALLTSLSATSGPVFTATTPIGEGGNTISLDFFARNVGSPQYSYLYFFISGRKSTGTGTDAWDLADMELNTPLASRIIYHNATYLNPVPLNIYSDMMLSGLLLGIAPDYSQTFNPFANYASSVYISNGWDSVKLTITNDSPVQVIYTTLFDVTTTSYWGTEEQCPDVEVTDLNGAGMSLILLEPGTSKTVLISGHLFSSKGGEYEGIDFDVYPTAVVNTHVTVKFGSTTLGESGTFKIKAIN